MRWSLRLSEFDFEIEHVPGSKIKHVDALSRHVGLVEGTQLMSKALMLREQRKDLFCKQQIQNRLNTSGEYFLDMEGVLYRRGKDKQPKLVVPQSLIQDVIDENHNPIFVAHPGNKRTFELIFLKYWWPKMRQSIEEYIRRCDKCQMRKGKQEFRAPLGEVEAPSEPFQVTSLDITGPYLVTPRTNRYLLTFIDHFSKYVEAVAIPDVSAETCARVYATQIVARHGSGSTLITDRGRQFTSPFFRETCKILRIRKVRTSAYHAMSNGMVERFHRVHHDSIAHYIVSTGTNWDVVLPFFVAYRATPHSTTQYSPFYLLPGREMVLPKEGDLKARISPEIHDVDQVQRLENLKASLLEAYKEVRLNNRKAHQKNKAYYDKKAKERKFEVHYKAYLFCPARKPGRCHKFRSFWQGPFVVVQKLSYLNYKTVDKKGKEFVFHINRLKKLYDRTPCSFEKARRSRKKTRQLDIEESLNENAEIQSRPIATGNEHEPQIIEKRASGKEREQLDQEPQVLEHFETPGTDRNGRRQMSDSLVGTLIMNPQILHVPEESWLQHLSHPL